MNAMILTFGVIVLCLPLWYVKTLYCIYVFHHESYQCSPPLEADRQTTHAETCRIQSETVKFAVLQK